MSKLDKKDSTILELLKENANLKTHQISKRTKIPISTVHNRIKKMEKRGIIKKYTIIPDYKKLGEGIVAYVLVSISHRSRSGEKLSEEKIGKQIKKYMDAEEVSIIAGERDMIAKVRTKDIERLNSLVTKTLRDIEGVEKTTTLIAMEEIK